jgi:sugar phosphate isomerase/epimerase
MELGIFTQYFRGAGSIEELAVRVRKQGFDCVVLDTYPGLKSSLQAPLHEEADRIKRAFESNQLYIQALGAYMNLLHPDPVQRSKDADQFKRNLLFAGEIGAKQICTEIGTYHPDGGSWDPSNVTEHTLQLAAETLMPLVNIAHDLSVDICLEPYVYTAAYSPMRMAELLAYIGSDRVKVVFDLAGMLTRATLGSQQVVISDMTQTVGSRVGLVHAHDVRPAEEWQHHFQWMGAGTGMLNYELFMDALVECRYEGPIILEFLEESQMESCSSFVQEQYRQAKARKGATV